MTTAPARITEAFAVREVPGRVQGGRQCVELLEPLEYRVGGEDSGQIIVVPAGFVTDFASVPFGVRNLFPALGPWGRPAIIHDFLYRVKGETERLLWHLRDDLSNDEKGAYLDLQRARPDINEHPDDAVAGYTRLQADRVFLEAMEVVGIPAWRRTVMFRAVRMGGGGGWGS
ncbi:MAG: DUF1353 domain-containing protein [Caulobacteraceae bacterium]|nr:DUF1353 domain-containing protein [Caulobacteraceae bacterium]